MRHSLDPGKRSEWAAQAREDYSLLRNCHIILTVDRAQFESGILGIEPADLDDAMDQIATARQRYRQAARSLGAAMTCITKSRADLGR